MIATANEIARVPLDTDQKQVIQVTDAQRAEMIAAANEIARVPLGSNRKQVPRVNDATRAEMIAAANDIACKDFLIEAVERVYDKQEYNVETTSAEGMPHAKSAQQRGSHGRDSGRGR